MSVPRHRSVLLVCCVFLTLLLYRGATTAEGQPTSTARITSGELLSAVQTLSAPELEGRRTGSVGNAKARAWIVERFREARLEDLTGTYTIPFQFTRGGETLEGVNVSGICRGSGAADGGALIISAHYDHLGVRDGLIYAGADDNASGVAVLLGLARHCRASPWRHDAVFVAFDAEELGLRGARAFVQAPPIPRERLALNVNMDMVSRSDKRELYVAGTYHSPALKAALEKVALHAPVKLLFGHDRPKGLASNVDDWTMQSDHGAFHAAGIPFVYFGVEDHADYHKPTDTADKISPQFFQDAAQTILDAISALDRALPLPRQ